MKIQPEQILVTSRRAAGGFWLDGQAHTHLPWDLLRDTHLYAPHESDLTALLKDATSQNYACIDGSWSDRRGFLGFTIGLGPWGSLGVIHVRGLNAWAFDVPDDPCPDDLEEDPTWDTRLCLRMETWQTDLRALCRRLNEEPPLFAPTATRWLRGLYEEQGRPLEPGGEPTRLPPSVEAFCRKAHVGGPIIHARTTLAPYVSIDRTRAFGTAMLDDLPSGAPTPIPISGKGLDRWRPRDLMRSPCILEAEVRIREDLFVPLWPLYRGHGPLERAATLYPTGRFVGHWTSGELVALEQSGWGEVTRITQGVLFAAAPVLAPLVQTIRTLEPDLPFKAKRLEHMLYGICARGLSTTRVRPGPLGRPPLLRDLLDDGLLARVEGQPEIKRMASGGDAIALYRVQTRLRPGGSPGSTERPDRSAWITAQNRVGLAKILQILDTALSPARPGGYVGRIYVDGIDIEATPDRVPPLPGATVRHHGPRMDIYRSSVTIATHADQRQSVDSGGLLPEGASAEDLRQTLLTAPDSESGPYADGRAWEPPRSGRDPRLEPGQCSEPFFLEPELPAQLGFYADATQLPRVGRQRA